MPNVGDDPAGLRKAELEPVSWLTEEQKAADAFILDQQELREQAQRLMSKLSVRCAALTADLQQAQERIAALEAALGQFSEEGP